MDPSLATRTVTVNTLNGAKVRPWGRMAARPGGAGYGGGASYARLTIAVWTVDAAQWTLGMLGMGTGEGGWCRWWMTHLARRPRHRGPDHHRRQRITAVAANDIVVLLRTGKTAAVRPHRRRDRLTSDHPVVGPWRGRARIRQR
jgi:hypothetical protein